MVGYQVELYLTLSFSYKYNDGPEPKGRGKKRKLATEDETTLLTRKSKPVKKREMTSDLALSG